MLFLERSGFCVALRDGRPASNDACRRIHVYVSIREQALPCWRTGPGAESSNLAGGPGTRWTFAAPWYPRWTKSAPFLTFLKILYMVYLGAKLAATISLRVDPF